VNIEDLAREAARQGFAIEHLDGVRYKFLSPDKDAKPVFAGRVGGDPRMIKNLIAELRRAGFLWPPPEIARLSEPSPPHAPAPPARAQASGITALEELFHELKDARELFVISAKQLEEAEEAVTVAANKRDQARADVDGARANLEDAKKRFDRMCGI
jgi:hypothetical protein